MTTALNPKDILQRIENVPLDPDEIAVEIETPPQAKKAEDPKAQREYTFEFSCTMDGKKHVGKFTSKILTIAERQASGVLRAQYSGGLAYERLDPYTRELNAILAHLEFALKDRPAWAKNLRELEDDQIVYDLYSEVLAHEATFRGSREGAPDSQGKPQ